MTSVTIPGPDGPEPWGAQHHGRFRVPDFGERAGFIAFAAKFSADDRYWMRIWAKWSRWVEETGTFEAVETPTLAWGPAAIGDTDGDFGYRTQIAWDMPAQAGATHWQPVLEYFSEDPTGPGADVPVPPGARIRIDDIYIPDNGYSVAQREYLDGNQPLGRWEGEPNASTSIYGPKDAPLALERRITIEPELLVPDGAPYDPSDITTLDDDLTI